MSHPAQIKFVERVKNEFPNFFYDKSVIEIGSLDINGSIRGLFSKCRYVGVDLAPGPGVDVVAVGHTVDTDLGRWDVVCSCEMFEHNPLWVETWARMVELCRPGGLVFFSCATEGRAEHGTSRTSPTDSPLTVAKGWEYYRNLTDEDFKAAYDFDSAFRFYSFAFNDDHHDLYFYGIKR